MPAGVERDELEKKLNIKIRPANYSSKIPAKFKDEKSKDIKIKGDPLNKLKSELEIEKEIESYLFSIKIQFWNMKVKGELQSVGSNKFIVKASKNRGFPDILCCFKGLFIGIEVKKPGGKQSIYQQEMQKIIEKAGGFYFIVTSVRELNDYFNEKILLKFKASS